MRGISALSTKYLNFLPGTKYTHPEMLFYNVSYYFLLLYMKYTSNSTQRKSEVWASKTSSKHRRISHNRRGSSCMSWKCYN